MPEQIRGLTEAQARRLAGLRPSAGQEITAFARELVRIPSVTGAEEGMARSVARRMRALGYDEVIEDPMGNVVGVLGSGEKTVFFDSHMDTVAVNDPEAWRFGPFEGVVEDGNLYGRGAVDMKGALAASVYAAVSARDLGLLEGKRAVVSASVMEEDYDGEAVRYILEHDVPRPDFAVICEPTDLHIGRGHQGRALLRIVMPGRAAHGSRPQEGDNPVYRLGEVIARVRALAERLQAGRPASGTVALTNILCATASNNSVPAQAEIILDRRLSLAEDEAWIRAEMDALVAGTPARWEIVEVPGVTWTGREVTLHSFFPAWELGEEHHLVRAAARAVEETTGAAAAVERLMISTNAVVTAGAYGIPTVVVGPGDVGFAHARDERCPVAALAQAWEVYVRLCGSL